MSMIRADVLIVERRSAADEHHTLGARLEDLVEMILERVPIRRITIDHDRCDRPFTDTTTVRSLGSGWSVLVLVGLRHQRFEAFRASAG